MKKNIKTTLIALFALLPLGMQAQSVVTKELYEGTQILNSDFEDFHIVTGSSKKYIEPDYWHSFATADGSFASAASQNLSASDDIKQGLSGESCLSIKSTSAIIYVANATVTTGRMNAGAMKPSDVKNNAHIEKTEERDKDGFPFYAELSQRPTAISLWVKFVPKEESSIATFSAVITNGSYYQEPKDKDYKDVVVAEARDEAIESGDWRNIVKTFEYSQAEELVEKDPQAIMITLSTSATPGGGSVGDELLIDDLELIYTQQVTIPDSGYFMMTNVAMKNHKVVIPEGITAYTLEANSEGQPKVKEVYTAGQVLPYEGAVLLEGKPGEYPFSTTLYETEEDIAAEGDLCVVKSTELNTPTEEYKFFRLTTQDGQLGFYPATYGLKIQESEALLRVKADKAADSYQHILFTPDLTGDINDDGQQSIADITVLVNRLLGKQEQSSKLFIPSADVNGDSSTTISDVTELVNILLGKGN